MRSLFLLTLISSSAGAHNLEDLRLKAVELFQREIGATDGKISIEVDPPECLRTGYKRSEKKVVFCHSGKVINGGLESVDVINHEFFHALFCGKYPDLCATDDFDYINEALADVFAYRLNPDPYFGENFYTDYSYMRPYATDWMPELVQSPHEQGTALAARLIRENKKLSESLPLFTGEIRSFVSVEVEGAPYSRLNRYRLDDKQEIKINFHFDPKANVREVAWELPPGLVIDSSIRMTEGFQGGKAFARFLSADKKELGRWTFYFGRKL